MTAEQKQILNVLALEQIKLEAAEDATEKSQAYFEDSPKSFLQMAAEAETYFGGDGASWSDVLTVAEMREADFQLEAYKKEFNGLCQLSGTDIKAALGIGVLGCLLNAFLVGVPKHGLNGVEAGCFANVLRGKVKQFLSEELVAKLEAEAKVKVTYDLTSNVTRNAATKVQVAGLSAYYHRFLSLGHDASWVGMLVGIYDILSGSMTTIDKKGRFVSQEIVDLANRKESDIVAAYIKYIKHLLSDATTSMGLPAAFMPLANLCQFGKFFEDEKNVAELAQEMYYAGYDLIHFSASSLVSKAMELLILGYGLFMKKTKYQNESMRFIAHSIDLGLNLGVVSISRNIAALDYSEVLCFLRSLCKGVHWQTVKKSGECSKFIYSKWEERLAALTAVE